MYCPTETRAFFEATTERPMNEDDRHDARLHLYEWISPRIRGARDELIDALYSEGLLDRDIEDDVKGFFADLLSELGQPEEAAS